MNEDDIVVLERGDCFNIVALKKPGGRCEVSEFLSELDENQKQKIVALFKVRASRVYISNAEKFKKVHEHIFEFKSYQVRLYCFFDRKLIVITHGVIKKQDKARPEDIEKAERIRSDYFSRGGQQ